MITDTEIKVKGFQILTEYLGKIEAERFVALIQREPFDYTKWQRDLWKDKTVEELSKEAMDFRRQKTNDEVQKAA
ncbi:MAG: hypothetical protein GY859_31915 [Desulfobacterales bacterium]|nr:hypothetical protein [Desulfobacterales bacterium]